MYTPATCVIETRARADGVERQVFRAEFVRVQPDAITDSRSYAIAHASAISHTHTRADLDAHARTDLDAHASTIWHTHAGADLDVRQCLQRLFGAHNHTLS